MASVPVEPLAAFLWQAALRPAAVAILDDEGPWTYRQLASAAARLADRLDRAGVEPGSLVGLSVTRGRRVVAGILGIWLRGCAYVPIDPDYPESRRSYLARDAGTGHLVVDGPDDGFAVAPGESPPGERELPGGLAYVIYTSGSTGEPKGVLVRHANLRALFTAAAEVMPAGPQDVGTVFHSYCFDFSVWEIWRVLAAGGRCVFVPAEARTDGESLGRLLAGQRVTLLSLVPSVFANLVQAVRADRTALPHLREVVLGGEAMDLNVARTWLELGVAPRARLVNMYGITETTVHVTARPLDAERIAAFRGPGTPIGRPLPHLRVTVRNPDGAETPPGEVGEMHVAGGGVAAGYLGRPELTGRRFRPGPGAEPGIWYRTGDLARREADGELVYLGRSDAQIQLRGHRIEPGEVAAAIGAVPGVAGAGVTVVPNRGGEPVLVACYVPAGAASPTAAELRAALHDRLPRHLVPARLVPVDRLPVTAQGKLDRAALVVTAGGVSPAGHWQTLVADVWSAVLGFRTGEVAADDDFFELGGHSLAAGRVAGRLSRRTGRAVTLRLLYDHPVLSDLASALAGFDGNGAVNDKRRKPHR
ncbi:non-ribosomal peptide synthetase [Actinoplanes sp. NPDC026623]|uniref:non-ribosomal peptide synthetase n=1 Tax=Actinoplanes sp. NPDC026623 TaxID=3155610 RepID=UPI003409BEE9